MSKLKYPVSFSLPLFTPSFRRRGEIYAVVLSAAIASGCASSDLPDLNELSLREHEARDRLGKKFEAYVKTARLRSTLPDCPAGGDNRWRNCFGVLEMANGDRYAGDFGAHPDPNVEKFGITFFREQAQGKLSGVGVSLTKKGLYYGQWALGQERGLGRRYLNDGTVYVGIHENGRRSGDGIQYSSNGVAILSGRWEEDRLASVHSLSESRFPFRGDMAFPTVAWPLFDVTFSDGVDQNSSSKHAYTAASSQANGVTPRLADTELARLQTEVLLREREQAEAAARVSEEKRLRARLAELSRLRQVDFNDDLPGLLANTPASKPNPRVHVLAVGINDYADVPDVPFADRSAEHFVQITERLLGARSQNVILLTNAEATSGRLRGRIRVMLNRLGPQDQLLFYYAGHGVPGKDGGSAYLLAQDGGSGSYEEPDLRLEQLYLDIAKSGVGEAILFIDACFSGRSAKDTLVFEGIAPITLTPKQSFPDATRLAVITAGRGHQFSNWDKTRGHRLFSYHLMRVLLEDGLKLEVAQLHNRLRERVLDHSRRLGPEFEQEPDLLGNRRLTLQ